MLAAQQRAAPHREVHHRQSCAARVRQRSISQCGRPVVPQLESKAATAVQLGGCMHGLDASLPQGLQRMGLRQASGVRST
jgi:hypothetical protein